MRLSGGTLKLESDLEVTRRFNWTGGMKDGGGTLLARGGLILDGGGQKELRAGTVANGGSGTLGAGIIFIHRGATLANAAGARLIVVGAPSFGTLGSGPGEASFRNEGTLTRADGSPTGILSIPVPFTQTATGTLALRIGGPTAGTHHDQIRFSGPVALGGTLAANTIGGFEPPTGGAFQVLTYGTPPTGAFATIEPGWVATADTKQLVLSIGTGNPIVNAGADGNSTEGSTFARTGSFINPGRSGWTATVDYGDGAGKQPLPFNPDKTFRLDHTYADNGIYPVTVEVTNNSGGVGTGAFEVDVANALPVVTAAGDQTAEEGVAQDFSLGRFTDPGPDGPWTLTVDWGDGETSALDPIEAPGELADLAHTYAQDGAYVAKVTVAEATAEGPEPLVGTAELDITVDNLKPVVDAGADATIDEGATFSGDVTFIDPGADDWVATVDYGDDSPVEELTPTERGFALSHRYADNAADGPYTIRVTVADEKEEQGTGADELLLTVENLNPTLEVPAPAPVPEGGTV